MNLKFTSFIFTLLFFCHSHAQNQNTLWVKNFPKTSGSNGEIAFHDMALDQAGNIYVIGRAEVEYDLDPSLAATSLVTGSFFGKFNPSGNLIFMKEFTNGVTPLSLAVDDLHGYVYVAGMFSATNTYFLASGMGGMISSAGNGVPSDGFVSKFNTAGTFYWVKTLGGTGGDMISQIAVDASENLYLYGEFSVGGSINVDFSGTGTSFINVVGTGKPVLWKTNNNGTPIWVNQYNASNGNYRVNDMILDANNNIYATGSFRSTVDFNPSPSITDNRTAPGTGNPTPYEIFIKKINGATGDLNWAKTFGGINHDTGEKIGFDANGNIVTAGSISSASVDADPGPGISYIPSGGHFVHKLDVNGNFIHAYSYIPSETSTLTGFHCEQDGSYLISGWLNGSRNIFLVRMSSTGTTLWQKIIGENFSTARATTSAYRNGSWFIPGYIYRHPTETINFQVATTGTAYNMTGTSGYLMKIYTGTCVNTASTRYRTACTSFTVPSGDETYTVSGTYMDTIPNARGCDSILTIHLTIGDAIAPVPNIASLPSVTEICSVTSLTAPTATDNCAGTITGIHNATLPITTSGTTVVTWTYNDGNGNTSTQTQNVVITDNVPPVADAGSLTDVTGICSVTSLTAPTATDNCTGTVTGTHNATLPITAQGTTIVTWTYNDGNGNTSTQTQNVIINDNIAPVPNVASLSNVIGTCSVASLTAPTATDNCAGTITGTHNATLPITTSGTITWTYNDGHGNSSTQTQNVVINDNTAPVANVASLPSIMSQCSVTSLTAPTATDNCAGTITGTHNITLPITTQGTTVVTWTYDDGNGNTATQTQNVVITDNTAPVANTASLAAVTGQCSVASLTAPTATDNCAGTITGTTTTTFPITTQGTTVVTWTYDDGNGNTSIQTQNVVITDNIAPVADLSSLPDVTNQCSVTSLTAPTATDNCAGTITGTHNAQLPINTFGTTTITWTYNDGHGNTSTQTQNIIITDNTAPVANLANLSTINSQCPVTSLTAPTATDNCAGTVTGTHSTTLPITTSGTITWTYNDGHGNTSTQMQNVVINDNTAPVVNNSTLPDINAICSVTTLTAPMATDNCAGAITGTTTTSFPITIQGTTVVTWIYDDGKGNTSTQTQNVIVTAPVATTSVNGITITATTAGATYQWVNCGNGNTPITGATSQSYTATANGTYAVIVTQNGCSATSACVTISTVGIAENDFSGMQLFPNPTSGIISLAVENGLSNATIHVISTTGKVINQWLNISGNLFDMDLSEQVSGMYFIEVRQANQIIRFKVNKQ